MALSRPAWLADLSRSFKRHRQGRPGWSIEEHRDRLRLVSSELPPRPDEQPGTSPKRRAVTLTAPPGPGTALAALTEACSLFDAVMAGAWRWPDADDVPAADDRNRLSPAALQRLVDRLEKALVGEQITKETWRRMYKPFLGRLVATASERAWQDATELLTTTLRHWQPGSRSRQMAHDRFRQIWRQAGWPWPESVQAMRGNGKAAAPPEGVMGFKDEEIMELRERIKRSRLGEADLVAWDCLAVFGLRPAELIGLRIEQHGSALAAVVTHEKRNSKGRVGARIVPAVPPAGWPADCHGLLQRWETHGLPDAVVSVASPGTVLGQQMARLHRQQAAKGTLRPELTSYGLRHAFALRLGVELRLSVREAAELMGHSPQVHLNSYGRRLETPKLLAKVAELAANR